MPFLWCPKSNLRPSKDSFWSHSHLFWPKTCQSCLAWCRVLMDRKSKRSQIVIGILNRVSRHDRRRTTRILDSETWQWTRAQILWAFWFDISVVLLKYGFSWVLSWAFPYFSFWENEYFFLYLEVKMYSVSHLTGCYTLSIWYPKIANKWHLLCSKKGQ